MASLFRWGGLTQYTEKTPPAAGQANVPLPGTSTQGDIEAQPQASSPPPQHEPVEPVEQPSSEVNILNDIDNAAGIVPASPEAVVPETYNGTIPDEGGRGEIANTHGAHTAPTVPPVDLTHLVSSYSNHPDYQRTTAAEGKPLTPRTETDKKIQGLEEKLMKSQRDNEEHLAHVSQTLRKMLENMNKHVDRLEQRIESIERRGPAPMAGSMSAADSMIVPHHEGMQLAETHTHGRDRLAMTEAEKKKQEAIELGLTPNENTLFARKKGRRDADPKAYVAVKDDVPVLFRPDPDQSSVRWRLKQGEIVKPTGDRKEGKGHTMIAIEAMSEDKQGGWVDRALLKETATKKTVRLNGKLVKKGEDATNKIGPHYITSYTHSSFTATSEEWKARNEWHKFTESSWDASIFAFIELFSFKVSAFIMFVFLLTCLIQLVLVMYLGAQILSGEIAQVTDKDIKSLQDWRHTIAHDARWMDPVTKESLARKVCDRSPGLVLSGTVKAILDRVTHYQPHESMQKDSGGLMALTGQYQGVLLCAIGLLLWWNTCVCQFRAVISTVVALWNMTSTPTETLFIGFREDYEREAHEGGFLKLEALHKGRKMWAYWGVCFIRFVLALLLLLTGTIFLIFTLDVQDLILNSIALIAVIRVDELLFASCCEFHTKQFLSCLAPVRKPPFYLADCCKRKKKRKAPTAEEAMEDKYQDLHYARDAGEQRKAGTLGEQDEEVVTEHRGGIGAVELRSCLLILLVLGVAGGTVPFLMQEMDKHKKARMAICDGYLDFVYSMDPGGALAAYPTRIHPDSYPLLVTHKQGDKDEECPVAGAKSEDLYIWNAVEELITNCHQINAGTGTSQSTEAASLTGTRMSVVNLPNIPVAERMSELNPTCSDIGSNAMVWEDAFLINMINTKFGLAEFVDCESVAAEHYCSWDNATGMAYRSWCSSSCGCSKPNSSLILTHADMGCPSSCHTGFDPDHYKFAYQASYSYHYYLATAECADSLPTSPALKAYVSGMKAVRDSYSTRQAWKILMNHWIKQLDTDGCKSGLLLFLQDPSTGTSYGTLCGENVFKLKPLFFICPVTCGCPGGAQLMPSGEPELCPKKCLFYVPTIGNGTNGTNGTNSSTESRRLNDEDCDEGEVAKKPKEEGEVAKKPKENIMAKAMRLKQRRESKAEEVTENDLGSITET